MGPMGWQSWMYVVGFFFSLSPSLSDTHKRRMNRKCMTKIRQHGKEDRQECRKQEEEEEEEEENKEKKWHKERARRVRYENRNKIGDKPNERMTAEEISNRIC